MKIRELSISTCVAVSMALASGAQASTRTWTGTNSGLWSDAGNWGGTAPVAGDDLVFPEGAPKSTTNDFPAGTTFASITVGGFNYTFGGNPIVLGAGGLVVADSKFATLNLDVTLGANQTWNANVNGSWTMSQPLHLNGATLTLHSGRAMMNGIIDGMGALDLDNFQLTLTAANTYQARPRSKTTACSRCRTTTHLVLPTAPWRMARP